MNHSPVHVRIRRAASSLAIGIGLVASVSACLPGDDCPWDPITGGYRCNISGGSDPGPMPGPLPPPNLGAPGGSGGGGQLPGGGGGSGPTSDGPHGLPSDVESKVNEVLKDDCKSLLSPVNPPFHDPKATWDGAPVALSPTPKPGKPNSLADAPVGVGSAGTITFYPPFFSTGPTEVFKFIPSGNGLTRLPSDEEMKAMTVLHEVAHLTGALNHDPAGSQQFNLLILEKCFGIQRIPVP